MTGGDEGGLELLLDEGLSECLDGGRTDFFDIELFGRVNSDI